MDKEATARKNLLRASIEPEGVPIQGYDFNHGIDYQKILASFATTGYQASHFAHAVTIINTMIRDHAFIYLGYTSNMISSGLREIIRYLVQHKKVHVIVTTAGGVEEDIIKCLGDFLLGDFRASGKELREKGINRIGNIYAPNARYVAFEQFFQPLLKEIYTEQQKTGTILTPSDLAWKLGEKINNDASICTWAWRNKIRVHCPALTDGAIGDNIYFFKFKHPDFKLDIAEDAKRLNDTAFEIQKAGLILLGSGVVKHHILNTNMLRNGADYAVYINTADEYDGSDAGAHPDEAISWGKIISGAQAVKIHGDATIIFPLLVAETFAKF